MFQAAVGRWTNVPRRFRDPLVCWSQGTVFRAPRSQTSKPYPRLLQTHWEGKGSGPGLTPARFAPTGLDHIPCWSCWIHSVNSCQVAQLHPLNPKFLSCTPHSFVPAFSRPSLWRSLSHKDPSTCQMACLNTNTRTNTHTHKDTNTTQQGQGQTQRRTKERTNERASKQTSKQTNKQTKRKQLTNSPDTYTST